MVTRRARPSSSRPPLERLLGGEWPLLAFGGVFVVCLVASFAVYWPRLTDYFVWDDFFVLRVARARPAWEVFYRAFTFPESQPFDEATRPWRPLTDLYFLALRPLGLHSEPYHAVNVVLHAAVGALGALFVARLTRSALTGAVTGLLFVLVPTYDIGVTWVSQISELTGALLMLAALLLYHAYLTGRGPARAYLAATVAAAAVALAAKESSVIVAVLLPALALALGGERQRSWRDVAVSLAPLAAAIAVIALAMFVRESSGGDGYRIGTHVWRNFRDYLAWMVYPYDFGLFRFDPGPARIAGAYAFLGACALAALLRQRALGFFALWTVAALLPFTGFAFGIEPRYTYLATLPFVAFVVSAAVGAVRRLPHRAAPLATALLGVALLAALVVAPLHTRGAQAQIAQEAGRYRQMVESARSLCGEMPPESQIFILLPPYRDLFGQFTQNALNLHYDRVYAAPVAALPELAGFIENKCVLRYDGASGSYVRLE